MKINGVNLRIVIGDLRFQRAPEVWLESERHKPLTRAGVTLPDPIGNLFETLTVGQQAVIGLGLRDSAMSVWEGTVAWVRRGETKDQVMVGLVGKELPLTKTTVKAAWINETPEAIVRHALRDTGLDVNRIVSTGYVLPRFTAHSISVWQLVNQVEHSCQRAFDLDMSAWALWLGADGINWGDFDEDGNLPVIATGAGLVRHSPAGDAKGLNLVETFLVPWLRHSMLFQLTDKRRGIDGRFRALKVRHELTDTRARTFISYGVEHGRF